MATLKFNNREYVSNDIQIDSTGITVDGEKLHTKKNILNISGGATKIGGLYGAARALIMEHGFQPDVISGISAGSILALPLALKRFNTMDDIITNFGLNDFFSQPPLNEKGRITWRAIWNIIRGRHYLGKQDNLIKTLRTIITEKDFDMYKAFPEYPDVYVGYVQFNDGTIHYPNLKDLSYEEALNAIQGSSSIPVFTEGVVINGEYSFDGGVRQHILSVKMLDNFFKPEDINNFVSIYSRPEDYRIYKDKDYKPKGILDILQRNIDIQNTEISKSSETIERLILQNTDANLVQIFIPQVMDSLYDVKPDNLELIYTLGRMVGNEAGYKLKK